MAGSVNKVIIIGNLGNDPDVRQTQDGRSVCNLSVATTESWRDKQTGEKRERTEWHRVVIFNEQLCKVAQQYLKKGAKVYLEGQLQTRKWQDNAGQERQTTEIVLQNYAGQLTMLDGRNGSTSAGGGYGGGGFNDNPQSDYDAQPAFSAPPRSRETSAPKSFSKDLDDEIPF